MSDNLKVDDKQSAYDNAAEEMKTMLPFSEEMAITKTEVKEEIYDFETENDFEFVNVKDEYISSPEDESSMLTNDTEHLLTDNLDVGSFGTREMDLQSKKNRQLDDFTIVEEAHLKRLYHQNPPGEKRSPKVHIHLKRNEVNNKFECPHCSYSSLLRKRIRAHIDIHIKDKPFKCTYKNCKCIPGEENFCECDICEYATITRYKLKKHMAVHYATSKEYKCKDCDFATRWKKSLVLHTRNHTGEKPYKCTYKDCKCTPGQEEPCDCNECEHTFVSEFRLKRHILSKHSTEPKKQSEDRKQFKCKNCEFVTHWKKCLVIHARSHTGERPYKCKYKDCKCTPGQEEPCDCSACEYAAVDATNLRRHTMSKHNIEPKKRSAQLKEIVHTEKSPSVKIESMLLAG